MRRSLHLSHLEGAGASVARLELKLDSSQAATGLYRCITEKHAFYSCETVRSAVTSQFIRDLKVRSFFTAPRSYIGICYLRLKWIFFLLSNVVKYLLMNCVCFQGTIVSIFNEDTSLGKKYVFDIRRTCREVYDNARRALYLSGEALTTPAAEANAGPEDQGGSSLPEECTSPGSCNREDCMHKLCKVSFVSS